MIKKDEIIDYIREYEGIKLDTIERELSIPLDSNFIITIIGPRRAGKTYYLIEKAKNMGDSIYLNFEDIRLSKVKAKEIREIIRIFIEETGKKPKNLFLDEIQIIEGWESVVRSLYDLRKYRIFITGSSSKLLSKEISTKLRGRSLSYLMLPLSFREFIKFKGKEFSKITKDEEAEIRNLLKEYLEFGGFPDVVLNKEKTKILYEYVNLILFRDFVERHNVKNIGLAKFIHYYILENFANEMSVNKIFNKAKANIRVGKDTIYNYIEKLEDNLSFFFVNRYSDKVHLRESWPKKVYVVDTGLTKTVRNKEDFGKLMENNVFLELLRRKNKEEIEIFYYKENYEVDFVVKKGQKFEELIQVSYAGEVKEREIRSLVKASEKLKCKNLICITWDYEGKKEIKGKKIEFIPLWRWLLRKG